MSATLSTTIEQIERRLGDTTSLIWSSAEIEEGIRAALLDLSNCYGSEVTLKDLDSALITSYEAVDQNVLVVGAVSYCLTFRLVEKLDEHLPTREDPDDLCQLAKDEYKKFQAMLFQVKLRMFAESGDTPYSQWEWDEGSDFS
jgi:hypothetical protein